MDKYARYALAYLLWAVSIVSALVVAMLTRDALVNSITILAASSAERVPIAAFDISLRVRATAVWSYPILGVILIIVIVALESYYRTAVPEGKLLSRFLKVTAVLLTVLAVGHIVYFLVALSANLVDWSSIAIPAIELAAAAVCAWLYTRTARSVPSTQVM